MWDAKTQQFAVAFVVFSSVFGSVIGPLVGPFIQAHLSWQWICWTQLIFGGFVQILHFFLVPETRSAILLDREAKRRRNNGETNIYGPSELKENRFSKHEILKTWYRPFQMFLTEPIVLFCSLLSGFSDALIFTFLEAFTPVYKQWNFTTEQMALTFIPLAIGYFIAWISYLPPLAKQRAILKKNPNAAPELRLWWLLYRKFRLALTRPCMLIVSCTARNYRSVWFRLDFTRSTQNTLDRADDLLWLGRYCQLRHLHVHHRLYDRGLRTVLCQCYRR